MKLAKDVTRDMLANMIEQALSDMDKAREQAREAYEMDSEDDFHGYMDSMFGIAINMIKARLSTLCEENDAFENIQESEWCEVCFPQREPGPDIPPYYDQESREWTTRVDERRESGEIEYVCSEFARKGLIYPFRTDSDETEWHDHEHTFAGVLAALLDYPDSFSVRDFEEYYSKQELEMLRKVQEKLLAMKNKASRPEL